jgi:hypothetical protein
MQWLEYVTPLLPHTGRKRRLWHQREQTRFLRKWPTLFSLPASWSLEVTGVDFGECVSSLSCSGDGWWNSSTTWKKKLGKVDGSVNKLRSRTKLMHVQASLYLPPSPLPTGFFNGRWNIKFSDLAIISCINLIITLTRSIPCPCIIAKWSQHTKYSLYVSYLKLLVKHPSPSRQNSKM